MTETEELLTLTLFMQCVSLLKESETEPIGVLGVRGLMMMELALRNQANPKGLAAAREFFNVSCDLLREHRDSLSPLLEQYWRTVTEGMEAEK